MSNPTSNYGWQMPTATDLVTDLPADFEVFGQAVDTALMDLKGGTTGQVLKKNTNADMDFVWGADAAGMTNPMTTTGDIIYSSSGSTPARLGIGSSGQVLNVASGIPAWATPSSGSMTLLSTTSLSGASVTLSSISQSYRDLRLEIKDPTFSTNNSSILVRVNADTGNNYDSFNGTSQVGVANSYTGAQSESSFNLTRQYDMQNTSTDAAFMCNFYDYKDTTSIRLNNYMGSYQKGSSTAGDRILGTGQLYYKNVGTTISSMTILMSAGTFSTGTAYLYGVN